MLLFRHANTLSSKTRVTGNKKKRDCGQNFNDRYEGFNSIELRQTLLLTSLRIANDFSPTSNDVTGNNKKSNLFMFAPVTVVHAKQKLLSLKLYVPLTNIFLLKLSFLLREVIRKSNSHNYNVMWLNFFHFHWIQPWTLPLIVETSRLQTNLRYL